SWRRAGCIRTGSWIAACGMRSAELPTSYGAGGKDGVGHAVDDLFVGGTNGGKHAAEVGAGGFGFAGDEIIGAEPHTTVHGHQLIAFEIEPLRLDERGLMVTLQHERRTAKAGDGLVHGGGPIGMRQV